MPVVILVKAIQTDFNLKFIFYLNTILWKRLSHIRRSSRP